MPGIEPHRPRAGRRGQQQVVQVARRTRGSPRPRRASRSAAEQVELEVQVQLDLPGPAHRLAQPGVGRRGRGWSMLACARRCGARAFGVAPARSSAAAASSSSMHALVARRGTAPARGATGSSRSARRGRSSRGTSRPRPPCPRPPSRRSAPCAHSQSRSPPTSSASSANVSIRIERAPSSAARTSAMPLSASTNDVGERLPASAWDRRSRPSASGSRPASRAICALVRRFGLYGR